MNIKPISLYVSLLFSLLVALTSCEDRLDLPDNNIPEGSGTLTAVVDFPDLVPTSLGGSRSSGNEIESIKNIFVGIYNMQGQLMRSVYYTPSEWEETEEKPSDGIEPPEGESDMGWAYNDRKTPRVQFEITGMPFGRYYMYVAANVDNLATGPDSIREKIKTVAGLKSIRYDWKPENIALNDQMFGYFTESSKKQSTGYDAPVIMFTRSNMEIHSWIRRLASKVTIAYDPRGLKNDVTIYIHKVTLYDIPQGCYLGQKNPQWGPEDAKGVHPLPLYNRKPVDGGDGTVVLNSYFNYARDGITTAPVDENNARRGIKLVNGYVGEAAVEPGSVIQGTNHNKYDADALYFYENMQGDYNGLPEFNKFQQERGKTDGVGTNVTEPGTNPDGTQNDYKDKVPYGTYIEVEAFYDSKNPENVTSGPIKYRFMLGKNTTFNYDAQRNHHFKLTLGFRGWANQPDWHIEYDEPDPGLFLPDTWYVSYLYNQRSMLPIKVSSSCSRIELEITQNHWSPYDESTYEGPDKWPPEKDTQIWPSSIGETPRDNYNFTWAEDVVKGNGGPALNGWVTPQLGFLTLLVEGDEPENIPTSIFGNDLAKDYLFNKGMTSVDEAGKIFAKNKARVLTELDMTEEEDGRFSAKEYVMADRNNNYWVKPVEDTNGTQDQTQKTVLVPLWTMPKDIIQGSGFSGSNPYESYPRVANIHVKAYFNINDKDTIIEGDCRVVQPKRITNPKGVWRKSGTSGTFHVKLMELNGTNAHSNFKELISDGSWKASIAKLTNSASNTSTGDFISLKEGPQSKLNTATGEIEGESGSQVDFYIDFKGTDGCAIIDVEYNGAMSVHKILVREGYASPVEMGGNKWSTFSFYSATARAGGNNEYNVVLTSNPLALGSFVRREKVTQAIMVANNDRINPSTNQPYPQYGPMGQLGVYRLVLADLPYDDRIMWQEIGSNVNIDGTIYNYNGNSATSGTSLGVIGQDAVKYTCSVLKNRSMGTFYANGNKYKVPTLKDFKDLADECQFAFGILYGDAAKETEKNWDMATGFQDGDNDDDSEESKKGARGVIVYNSGSAEQIFFPVGKNGMGRRRQYNVLNGTIYNNNYNSTYRGTLWYSDLNTVMPLQSGANWYRPVCYNMKIDPGAIYWIDQWVDAKVLGNGFPDEPCIGWDINYMNLDFQNGSHNYVLDALPIKFIIVE